MPKGKVYVEKYDVLDQIVEASISDSLQSPKSLGKSLNTLSTHETILQDAQKKAKRNSEKNKKLLIERVHLEAQRTETLIKANVQKTIEKKTEKEDRRFHSLKDDVDSSRHFLRTIDKTLQMQDEANLNKVRRQFDDWNNTVHAKIQGNISSQVNAMDYKDINARRNEDFQKYLDITNKKAAIFRDIIIESEYDPLEPNRRSVKAVTGKLKMPTNMSLQKRQEEMSMLAPVGHEQSSDDSLRYTMPVEHWATGKIEATPHGYFAKMMDDSRRGTVSTAPATFKSTIHFNDFSFPMGKKIVDDEVPRGKRVFPMIGVSTMKAIVNYDDARKSTGVVTGSALHDMK